MKSRKSGLRKAPEVVGASRDAFDRLRLIRSENVGPVTYRHLISKYGSAARALEAIPDLAARGGGKSPKIADATLIQKELRKIEQLGKNLRPYQSQAKIS